jgi:DNA polymerase-1
MIDAFKSGDDIHALTARECFTEIPDDMSLDEVKKNFSKLRDAAKTINFGIVYGMSAKALSEQLNIAKEEASEYIDAYLKNKPKVKEYMIYKKREMERFGYVATPLGRRRNIPKDSTGRRPFGWDRKAINFPIQSASAEVLKYVMSKLTKELDEGGWDAKLIMQIHDELIIEAEESISKDLVPVVRRVFESAVEDLGYHYDVPLSADPAIQARWAVEVDICGSCGKWGKYEDRAPDGNSEVVQVCIHCDAVRYPKLSDLEDTFSGFEQEAVA